MPEWGADIRRRLANSNLSPQREAEIVEELAQHLQDRYDELVTAGTSPAEAQHAVAAEIEDSLAQRLAAVEESYAPLPALGADNHGGIFTGLWYDIKYGLRQLRLNPGFTLVAVISLALGIGANTAMFQLLDAVRLRSLPVHKPEELALVRIANQGPRTGSFSGPFPMNTNAQWERVRAEQQAFSGVFAWGFDAYDLAQGGESKWARGLVISGDGFAVLGVKPAAGRLISAADDQRGCGAPGAVLSHAFWQRQFAGDPSAIGKTLTLNGKPVEIIGVTEPDFFGMEVGRRFDVALPLCSDTLMRGEESRLERLDAWWLGIMGRLKPGWTMAQAAAQLESISPGIFQSTVSPRYNPRDAQNYSAFRLTAVPGATGISGLRREYQEPLWLLLALAGSVLLIACANLANLMLARASAREKEIAVRIALGAARARVVRQLLTESALLAAGGAIAGVVLALNLSSALVSFFGARVFVDVSLDWRMLSFTAAVAGVTCVLFGLAPALRASRTPPAAAMNASGRGITASRERFGVRRTLVVAQVAVSLVLLVGSFLFARTLRNLNNVDAGFRRDGILAVDVDLSRMKLPPERRIPIQQDLLDRVRAIPGVTAATATAIVPVSGNGWNELVEFGDNKTPTEMTSVTADYFKTLGIPLLAGRVFDERDTLNAPAVAIVNEKFAQTFLGGGNAVGKTFRLVENPGEPQRMYEVVGLVGNTKYGDLREDFPPIAYVPEAQDKQPDAYVSLLIHSDLPLDAVRGGVTRSAAEISPQIGLNFTVFDTQLREGLLRERLLATLSGFFGVLAAVLAMVGLYGVIAYMVIRRTNEIGIRMALGADRRAILMMIAREAGQMVTVALVIGIGLTLLASRAVSSLLYGLTPRDPLSLVGAAAAVIGVAVVATFVPAQRAADLDPMAALRQE